MSHRAVEFADNRGIYKDGWYATALRKVAWEPHPRSPCWYLRLLSARFFRRHFLLRFDDVFFRALYKCDYIVAFRRSNLEGLQGGIEVSQKSGPIALTDFHSLMRHLHLSSDVVQRTASTRTEKINQKLLFPL